MEWSHGHTDSFGFSMVFYPHMHGITTDKTHILEATVPIIIVACSVGLYRVEIVDVDANMVGIDVLELDI